MVPRVGRQGKSFKGAALYYLHDKNADTAHRVEHTETRNLPTDNPELGWRIMAATAKDADRLKMQAGVDRRGRKLVKPVYHLSVAWHPEQKPERAHMVQSMDAALAALGLEKHQAVYAIHNDEPHPHIHAFVNLVNAEDGRSNSVRYSKRKLSSWAEQYEREHGVYCQQRIENNAKRARAKTAHAQKQPSLKKAGIADLKAEIARRYTQADSGTSFRASLEELGCTLAQGRRVVVITPDGKEHGLARQLTNVKAAALRAKLKDIELPALHGVSRKGEDRAGRSQRSGKAAREQTRRGPNQRRAWRQEEHGRPHHADREREEQQRHERDGDAGIQHQKDVVRTGLLNRLQDAQHQQLGMFLEDAHQKRHRLGLALEKQYGAHERQLRAAIAQRERQLAQASSARRWLSRGTRTALENDRLTLASIDQRKGEARAALERSLEERKARMHERHTRERDDVPRDFSPRQLDPLARSIEQQQAAANAAYLGAAAPVDTATPGTSGAGGATPANDSASRRAAYMQRAAASRAAAGKDQGPTPGE